MNCCRLGAMLFLLLLIAAVFAPVASATPFGDVMNFNVTDVTNAVIHNTQFTAGSNAAGGTHFGHGPVGWDIIATETLGAGSPFPGQVLQSYALDWLTDTTFLFRVYGGYNPSGNPGLQIFERTVTLSDIDWVNLPGQITAFNHFGFSPNGFFPSPGFNPNLLLKSTSFTADSISIVLNDEDVWNPLGFGVGNSPSVGLLFSLTADHTSPPIPEPSTFALFGIGILSVLGYGYRRKRRSAVTYE